MSFLGTSGTFGSSFFQIRVGGNSIECCMFTQALTWMVLRHVAPYVGNMTLRLKTRSVKSEIVDCPLEGSADDRITGCLRPYGKEYLG